MPTQITDGETIAKVDGFTRSIVTVNHSLHTCYAGDEYKCGTRWSPLKRNSTHNLSIKTPVDRIVQFSNAITSDLAVKVSFWEGVEVVGNGVQLPCNCTNRNSPDNPLTGVFKDANVATIYARLLDVNWMGIVGSKKISSESGKISHEDLWILRPNTWYSLTLEEISGKDQNVWVALNWGEQSL